jgi:hypothetical protein
MTLYLLEVQLQMFLSIPITQKWQILICDTLVANGRYAVARITEVVRGHKLAVPSECSRVGLHNFCILSDRVTSILMKARGGKVLNIRGTPGTRHYHETASDLRNYKTPFKNICVTMTVRLTR